VKIKKTQQTPKPTQKVVLKKEIKNQQKKEENLENLEGNYL
jgi:hypothetical protein